MGVGDYRSYSCTIYCTSLLLPYRTQNIFKLHSPAKTQVQSCDSMPTADISDTVWVWDTGCLITGREEVFAL